MIVTMSHLSLCAPQLSAMLCTELNKYMGFDLKCLVRLPKKTKSRHIPGTSLRFKEAIKDYSCKGEESKLLTFRMTC